MDNELVVKKSANAVPLPKSEPKLGEWYWITETARWDGDNGLKEGEQYKWFGCIMKIGSNFIELHSPHSERGGYSETRIHFDEFYTRLTKEENPELVIKGKISHWQHESRKLLADVRELVLRLGLNPKNYLTGDVDVVDEVQNSAALVVISGQQNIDAYKKDLIEAKEKTLPDLFKAIKEANEELCKWMMAETMETQALILPMEKSIDDVNNRIFTVSLYAGLTEQAIKISDGDPAALIDKLHVMQRKLYMDEECLLSYAAGGMEFSDIEAFDSWISKPENRDRILPFSRTLVAMQVRRKTKDRDWEGNVLQLFINMKIECSDKFTFLYVRNGEQLYRLSCEMEFGEMIFPDKNIYDPMQPKMVKMFCNRVDKMIPTSEYEILLASYNEEVRLEEQWEKENPGKHCFNNPYHYHSFEPWGWKPFDQSNLYFDECMETVTSQIREYNRIALIIQGLFDRSLVLHPHLPVKSWTPDGFNKAIKLVYDGEMTIYYGDPPDFEAYRAKKNRLITKDSIVTGQQDFWEEKEAEKENNRLDNNWRNKSEYRHKRFTPYGNPGPGIVAKISSWKRRSRSAIFIWQRERQAWQYYRGSGSDTVNATVTVPESRLFNISAYHPGEYKQFFNDPRTREQYLKWAPLLLSAEDYYAKKGTES